MFVGPRKQFDPQPSRFFRYCDKTVDALFRSLARADHENVAGRVWDGAVSWNIYAAAHHFASNVSAPNQVSDVIKNRRSKDHAVELVKQSALTGNQVRPVLDAFVPFYRGEHEAAHHTCE